MDLDVYFQHKNKIRGGIPAKFSRKYTQYSNGN